MLLRYTNPLSQTLPIPWGRMNLLLAFISATLLLVISACSDKVTQSLEDQVKQGMAPPDPTAQMKAKCAKDKGSLKGAFDDHMSRGEHYFAYETIYPCAELLNDEDLIQLAAQSALEGALNLSSSTRDRQAAIDRLEKNHPLLATSTSKDQIALAKRQLAKATEIENRQQKTYISAEQARKRREGVSIGMTQDDVLASSWGRPKHIHKTTTVTSTREQWVYGTGSYLYFENSRLIAIQN